MMSYYLLATSKVVKLNGDEVTTNVGNMV